MGKRVVWKKGLFADGSDESRVRFAIEDEGEALLRGVSLSRAVTISVTISVTLSVTLCSTHPTMIRTTTTTTATATTTTNSPHTTPPPNKPTPSKHTNTRTHNKHIQATPD